MSDENTLIQLLLLNEFLDIIGHLTIIVLRGMEGLSMVSQILVGELVVRFLQ
jgi:hypothetical protein